MPEDLKIKILTLNNLDSFVEYKNDKVLSSLNSKLNDFFNENLDYLISQYISTIKNDVNIKIDFNSKIITIIEEALDNKKSLFESEYMTMINSYIKSPFIEEYRKILIKEKNNILGLIDNNKESLKIKLDKLSIMEPDQTLTDIENKLNETLYSINIYNLHFNSFKIPDSVKTYLDEFGKNIILPKYKTILNDLNVATKEIIISNLNENSIKFENAYSSNAFYLKTKDIMDNLTDCFKQINTYINNYGVIEEKYLENLNKQISKSYRLRRLDNLEKNEKNNNKQRYPDYKIDKTFQELKDSSLSIKESIPNYFDKFNDKINKYIDDINYQKVYSQNSIQNIGGEDEANQKLNDLNLLSTQYYKQANYNFSVLRDFINKSVYDLDNLIQKSENITFETLRKKYIKIKDDFISTNKIINQTNVLISIPDYENIDDNIRIKTKIENYSIINQFYLDVQFIDENIRKPKVIGKVYNQIASKIFEINANKKFSQSCRELGRRIYPKFNNISLTANIDFDAGLTEAKYITNINVDEFNIETEFYEKKEQYIDEEQNGIIFEYEDDLCEEVKGEIPEGEQKLDIIKEQKINDTKYYQY